MAKSKFFNEKTLFNTDNTEINAGVLFQQRTIPKSWPGC